VEFNLSGFFAAIGVDVFDSVYIGNIFDDGNDSFEVISFDEVDDFLAEEFRKSFVALFSKLGIFVEILLHLLGKQVNQVFCPSILNGDLDDLLLVVNDVGNAVND